MARRRRARQADHQAARAGDEGRRIAVREHQAKKAATSPCGVANGISRHAESPDSRRGLLFAPTWPTRGRRRGSGQRGPPGGGSGETGHRGPPGVGGGEAANVARPGMAVGKRPTWPTRGWRRGSGQRGPPGDGGGEASKVVHPGTAAAKPATVAHPGTAVAKRPTWPTRGWRRGNPQ